MLRGLISRVVCGQVINGPHLGFDHLDSIFEREWSVDPPHFHMGCTWIPLFVTCHSSVPHILSFILLCHVKKIHEPALELCWICHQMFPMCFLDKQVKTWNGIHWLWCCYNIFGTFFSTSF